MYNGLNLQQGFTDLCSFIYQKRQFKKIIKSENIKVMIII